MRGPRSKSSMKNFEFRTKKLEGLLNSSFFIRNSSFSFSTPSSGLRPPSPPVFAGGEGLVSPSSHFDGQGDLVAGDVRILLDGLGWEPHDRDAMTCQVSIASVVVEPLIFLIVNWSVDLDRQAQLRRIKVQDERSDRILPSKLHIRETAVSKPVPDPTLRSRQVSSQLTRE